MAETPHMNLDAEERVIGAILLTDGRALDALAGELEPGDFYRGSHGVLYEACLGLYARGVPADPLTVADALEADGRLGDVGGRARVTELLRTVPAASNVLHYARIVREMALLRSVRKAGAEIVRLADDREGTALEIAEQAQRLAFAVTDSGASGGLRQLDEAVRAVYDAAAGRRDSGESAPGLLTGFADLDRKLCGLQPGNLAVLGARSSMGKTALGLGIAANVALRQRLPVALFSLEMDEAEVTQRILAAEARVESQRIRSGDIEPDGWGRLSRASGDLTGAPLHVDDAGTVSVARIRGEARRLKVRRPDLALVVVDYLQLVQTGLGPEQRVQGVGEVSRDLKLLARELGVPVLALAQLSRAPEQRHDKRPMLSDLRESGCLPAAARVLRADTGASVSLGELVLSQERPLVWALDKRWRLVPRQVVRAFPTGIHETYRVHLASGHEVVATDNHPFRTLHGWTPLGELTKGSFVAVPRSLPEPQTTATMDEDELVLLAHMLGNGVFGQGVRYSTADPACRDAVVAAAARRFGVTAKVSQRGKVYEVWLPSPYRLTHGRHHPMRPWIDGCGLWLKRAKDKFVPEQVFALPTPEVRRFLHHLWATDGSITMSRNGRGNVVTVYYSSSSRALADGVRRLLLRVGIVARLGSTEKAGYATNWQVRVTGKPSLERFLTAISGFGLRGARADDALAHLATTKENPNVDLVPQAASVWVKEDLATAGVSQRTLASGLGERYCGSYLLGSSSKPRRFSRDRLRRMGEIVHSSRLTDLATSDVLWDEVLEVTAEGKQPTFDLTVEGEHNFVADGVILHNSIENDADVVLFIYRDEYYYPDTTDQQGIAEVNVAKHRNGPTGTVKLAFVSRFAKFGDLAREPMPVEADPVPLQEVLA